MIRGAIIFGAGIAVGLYIAKHDETSLVDIVADVKKTADDLKVAAQTGTPPGEPPHNPEGDVTS
jgi:hypothetical protein